MALRQGAVEGVEVNSTFWSGKRVFLTGHTGFKGSWLSLWLHRLGADVTGYSLAPPSEPNLFTLAGVGSAMNSVSGDVRDPDALQRAMSAQRPDIVIHMAAQSLVRLSYAEPVETYATNVMGTVNVLEAARHTDSAKAIVVVTSDKCYENREWVWGYRETEPMGGADPYSNSKGCAELVTSAYRQSFFNGKQAALASVRAGNVIGGGDWAADRLVPDVVNAFMRKSEAAIRHPQAIRPWQHVLDPLSGYLTIAQRLYEQGGEYAEGWNFGPTDIDTKPVSWVVEKLAQLWGNGARWGITGAQPLHEAQYLKLDSAKARVRLQWSSQLDVAAALAWTVEWYKAFESRADMRETTLGQLERFQGMLDK